jgi:hypothetical protein
MEDFLSCATEIESPTEITESRCPELKSKGSEIAKTFVSKGYRSHQIRGKCDNTSAPVLTETKKNGEIA